MLENEPTTTQRETTDTAGDTGATGPDSSAAPARKRATRKRTTKKAAAEPAAADTADTAAAASSQPAEPAQPAQPAQPADTAGADAGAADAPAAKKAARRPAKKAAAKRPARRTAAVLDGAEPAEATPSGDPGTAAGAGADSDAAAAAPAKKTTRKRTGKKAAAVELAVQTDSPAPADAPGAPAGGVTGAAAVLFQPPVEPERPARRRTSKKAAAAAEPSEPTAGPVGDTPAADGEAADEAPRTRTRSRGRGRKATTKDTKDASDAPDQTVETVDTGTPTADQADGPQAKDGQKRGRKGAQAKDDAKADDQTKDDEQGGSGDQDDQDGADGGDGAEGEGSRRRRRRRGGRRRRKSGEGSDSEGDDSTDGDDAESEDAQDSGDSAEGGDEDDDSGEGSSSSRRRRRRRRRKGEDSATSPDDPDETVVKVREPRKSRNSEITAVEGSTRLEAKKQRRREGRAAGRRRAPIVSEAEFLARREAVQRSMVIRTREDLTQIAVSEDNVLVEHYVAQDEQVSLIGNVYLGRVQNVLPSMEAAFIDIGKGRNAVLYAGEVDWATLGNANGPRKIESVLKSGQSVLVQVTKDPVGHKGARLTNQISLPGRYVVYVPRGGNGGISRKLPDTERNRLKGILKDIVPDEAGVIVRTAAEGASEEELTRDVSRLKSYWEDIDKKSSNGGQAPQLLYGEPDLLIRVVRDLFTEDFTKLVISGDEAFDLVNEYVSYVAPHLADRVEKWSGDGDVFANFRIDEQIKKALDRKVWLPSGGSLIIDRTEAMTVVDVNTGKFTGSGGNLEETVTRNNLEAAEEMVRQLRLRDIGGIIVIDFIDMVLESNRDLVLRRLVECLGRDRTKHQVAEVTSLGLVQMTRKRIGTGLLEAFSETCDHCGGRGLMLHDEPREPKKRQSERGQSDGRQSDKGGDDSGKSGKSGRSGRSRGGRGKGKQEQQPEPETNGDAAQRLAEIAAASSGNGTDKAEPTEQAAPEKEAPELVVTPV